MHEDTGVLNALVVDLWPEMTQKEIQQLFRTKRGHLFVERLEEEALNLLYESCAPCGIEVDRHDQIQMSLGAVRSPPTSPVFTTPRGSISMILASGFARGRC